MPHDRSHHLPVRVDGVVSRRIDDEFIVIHPTTGTAHALSGACAQVWAAVQGGPAATCAPAEFDAAVVMLLESGLVHQPGLDRRSLLKRTGVLVGAAGIASIALPEAVAAASTTVSGTLTKDDKTVTVPKGARAVTFSITGGSGAGVAGGDGGRVNWSLGSNFLLPSALNVNFVVGKAGLGQTGGLSSGSLSGGDGGDRNGSSNKNGFGGGAASQVTFSGAASYTLIAGGGGGAAGGGGAGGDVDSAGAGGDGSPSGSPGAGGGAGGAANGTPNPGTAGGNASVAGTNGGGGGGGGAARGRGGKGATGGKYSVGGGAGGSAISGTGVPGANAPSFGPSAHGDGMLTYSYIIP